MTETAGNESAPKSHPQGFFEPAPGACQILLVRHGQSAPFVEGQPFELVDGQGNPPLSPKGEWQANQVGERLADEPIDAIYATSLQRTSQTAAPLAKRLGLDITIEPDLREVHLGEGEGGLFRQMASEGHPAALAMRQKQEWSEIPGAESNKQLAERCVRALTGIAERHPDQLVAVFCHGGVVSALLGHAIGRQDFTFGGCRNGSISHLVIGETGWIIRTFNDGGHVGPLTADPEPPT